MAQKLAKSRKKVQYKLHQLDVMLVLLFSGRIFLLSFYFVVLFSASSKVFSDLFLSHHTSWHISKISCLIGHFLLLIISHFMLETEERLDLSNGYRQCPKCVLNNQDWHGKGFNFVKWWIKMKCGVFLGFFTFLFILSFCKSALFDSQRCQIAGCKKKSLCLYIQ